MRKSIFVVLIAVVALSIFAGFRMRGQDASKLLQEYKEITLEGVVKDIVVEPGNTRIIVESEGKLYEVKIGPIWYLNIEVGDTVKIEGRLVTIDGKEFVVVESINGTELREMGKPKWASKGECEENCCRSAHRENNEHEFGHKGHGRNGR